MTLDYREGDTLKGDHSRATNPSGTCKYKAQKPASHMPQPETVCTDRQFIHYGTSCTSPQHHCGKSWLSPYPDVRSSTGEPVLHEFILSTGTISIILRTGFVSLSPKCISVKQSTTEPPEVPKSFRIHSSGTRLCPAQHTGTKMKG